MTSFFAISAPGELVTQATRAGHQPALVGLLVVEEHRAGFGEDQPGEFVLDQDTLRPELALAQLTEIHMSEPPSVTLM